MKKYLAVLLAIVLIASVFTGCAKVLTVKVIR